MATRSLSSAHCSFAAAQIKGEAARIPAGVHCMPPRAVIGQTLSTRPALTQTYQSKRSTVGSQCPGISRSLSPISGVARPAGYSIRACSSAAETMRKSGCCHTVGSPLSMATALCPASSTASPGLAVLMTEARTNKECLKVRNG